MLYALINVKHNTITYSSAASPDPIYGSILGTEICVGDGSGHLLGVFGSSKYENHQIDFPQGSFIFLYSDALHEAHHREEEFVGSERIISLVKKHRHTNAQVALDGIISEFNSIARCPLSDDMTTVMLCR